MNEEHNKWIDDNLPRYDQLGRAVKVLLSNILSQRGIEFLSVTNRTKSRDGIREKIERKSYTDPITQLTDIAGIRVITYLEDGVASIENLIREIFTVDDTNSSNKANDLGTDRVGYRSRHFVCTLTPDRLSLPEFDGFKDFAFEIQVRTILQHSWAEFSHDRNYKFSEVLPSELTRQLHLYSGLLELADQGFNEIARLIDKHKTQVAQKTKDGDLDLELTTESIYQFTMKKAESIGIQGMERGDGRKYRRLINEIEIFGIYTIGGLNALFSDDFVNASQKHQSAETVIGLLRDAMMFSDLNKYFQHSWNQSWKITDLKTVSMLAEKYPLDEVRSVLRSKGISIVDDSDGELTEV